MICKNCSSQVNGKFCPNCGTPVEQEPVIQQAETFEQTTVLEQSPVAQQEPTPVAQPVEPPVQEPVYAQPTYAPAQESYYQPPMSEEQPAPKKKKKKAKVIIIISVILALLIALFCVASFTDIIFSKKMQFGSIIKNIGSDVDVKFDPIGTGSLETKYSVKINTEHTLIKDEQLREEDLEVIDLINSLNISLKQNLSGEENKMILTAYEGDIKLVDVQALLDKDAIYGKLNFSDVVYEIPTNGLDFTDLNSKNEQLTQLISDEFAELVKNGEYENGKYSGYFRPEKDLKAIELKLDDDDVMDAAQAIIEGYFDVFNIDEAIGIDMDDVFSGENALDKITVNALYVGNFSFARESRGISIIIEVEDEEVELLFYSNKKDKAIYGISTPDGEITLTDKFEIDGDTQSGTITIDGTIEGESIDDELKDFAVTYTRKHNFLEASVEVSEDGETANVKYTVKGDGNRIECAVSIDVNSEELFALNTITEQCDDFDVNIDKSNAIDLTGSFDEDEVVEQLTNDLTAWVESNEEGVIFGYLNELIEMSKTTVLEQYMLDEFGIEHTQTDFEAQERGTLVLDYSYIVDVQEFGYENNIIKEMIETVYIDVSDYSYSQQQQVLDSMKESYEGVDVYGFAVTNELVGDYVVSTLRMWDMDDPETLAGLRDAGLVGGDPSSDVVYFDASAESMISAGYERVE